MWSAAKKFLLGNNIPQEYLCLSEGLLIDSPIVKMNLDGSSIDVTNNHLFLGYKPLIIGLIAGPNDTHFGALKNTSIIEFDFENSGKKIASLKLEYRDKINLGTTSIFIYEGINGTSKFLPAFYRFTNSIAGKLKPKKEGNVDLENNLYEQVKIAYSVPRPVRLISISKDGLYNVFPTDLNGRIDNEHFAISLRLGGKANEQLNNIKQLVICDMDTNCYKEIYQAGKNHMKDLREPGIFDFGKEKSKTFGNLIPRGTKSYLELELINTPSKPLGIHNLNFLRIANEEKLAEGPVLHHIHRDYALWRKRQGLATNYLLR